MKTRNLTDSQLKAKKQKAVRIFTAPYRKGLNYIKLLDTIRSITDELTSRSIDRAMNSSAPNFNNNL